MPENKPGIDNYKFAVDFWDTGFPTLVKTPRAFRFLSGSLTELLVEQGAQRTEASVVSNLAFSSVVENVRTQREKGEL